MTKRKTSKRRSAKTTIDTVLGKLEDARLERGDKTKRRPATAKQIGAFPHLHSDARALWGWAGNLDRVLGEDDGPEWLSAREGASVAKAIRRELGEAFPPELVPIAKDGAGNYDCHHATSGKVVSWDHETRRTRKASASLASYLRRWALMPLKRAAREDTAIAEERAAASPVISTTDELAAFRPTKIKRIKRTDLNKLDRDGYAGGARQVVRIGEDRLLIGFMGSAEIWDLEGRNQVAQSNTSATAADYDPHRKRVLLGDSTVLSLHDDDLGLLREWKATEGSILATAFSPDGDLAASAGLRGHVALWDMKKLTGIPPLEKRESRWHSPKEGKPLAKLTGLGDDVRWVAFASDGQRLAAGGEEGTVVVWSSKGRTLATSGKQKGRITCGRFRPGSAELAIGLEGRVVLLDDKAERSGGWTTKGTIRALAWLNANVLATMNSYSEIVVWDVAKRKPLASAPAPKGSNFSRLTVHGRQLITAGGLGLYELS